MDRWILSYKKPAEAWNEALPLGNGTLGVMSYGRLENETLELNLDTLWSGDGSSKLNKNGHADLGHLRKLLKDQKHQEAEDYCRKHILGDWTDSYLPAGRLNMNLQMSGQTPGGYVRQLSLNHAVETVASAGYKRELFVSMADPLLAVHFQAAPGQKLHLGISLESGIRYEKIKNCEDTVLLSGRAPSYVAPQYYDCPAPVVYEDGKGIRFTLAVKAVAPGGSVKFCDGKLLIEGEQDIFVYFTGNTDFGRNADTPQLEKECMEVLEDPDYEQLKKRHLGEYHKYFNRMGLSLNDTRENRLAEMMFHYARYLMICSSRPGSRFLARSQISLVMRRMSSPTIEAISSSRIPDFWNSWIWRWNLDSISSVSWTSMSCSLRPSLSSWSYFSSRDSYMLKPSKKVSVPDFPADSPVSSGNT